MLMGGPFINIHPSGEKKKKKKKKVGKKKRQYSAEKESVREPLTHSPEKTGKKPGKIFFMHPL